MDKFVTIPLALGDGGEMTLEFIQREILTRFDNPSLNELEDGSRCMINTNSFVVTTDSFVIDPPVFPGGDIGKLAVSGTVNDLIAAGAVPQYLTLGLILSEGLPIELVRQILDSIQQTAQTARVKIVAGDTKVLPQTNNPPVIYISTTGIGYPLNINNNYAVSNARPGDCIIITGSVGDHGFALLSTREGLGFEQRVTSDCAPLNELILPLINRFDGIRVLRDPTRGGLLGVLFDIAIASKADLLVDETRIPVKLEVQFGCKMLGIQPIELINEGKMVMIVDAEQSETVISELRQHPLGAESTIIGTVQSSNMQKVILQKGAIKKLAVRPRGNSLPRLC